MIPYELVKKQLMVTRQAGGCIKVVTPKASWPIGSEEDGAAISRQTWLHVISGGVQRGNRHRGRPWFVYASPSRAPDIKETGTIRREEKLSSVFPYGSVLVDRGWVIELGDVNGGTASLTIARHGRIVDIGGSCRGLAVKIKIRTPILRTLQVVRRLFVSSRGVHIATEQHRVAPGKIIVRIVPSREVDVAQAYASGAIALEKEQVSVIGKSWSSIGVRTIQRSAGVYRGLPGTTDTFALRYPDIGPAVPARSVRGEVKTQFIGRKRGIHLAGGRIDRRAYVYGR